YATPELNIRFGNILNNLLEFRHWIAVSMKGTFKRGNRLYPAHYSLLYYTKGEPKTFNNLRTPIPTCRHCGGEIPDYGGHREKQNRNWIGVELYDCEHIKNRLLEEFPNLLFKSSSNFDINLLFKTHLQTA